MAEDTAGVRPLTHSMAMPVEDLISEMRRLTKARWYMRDESDALMAIAAERLDDIFSGRTLVLPCSLRHAEMMNIVSERFLQDYAKPTP